MADKFREVDITTTIGTILTTQYNYQVRMSKIYAANTGTQDDSVKLEAQTLDDTGAITGTQELGRIAVPYGQTVVISDDTVEVVPAGSNLIASSVNGLIKLTYSRRYVYYRD